MGIDERRERERNQRRDDIVQAAFQVAELRGWSGFSVEQVAAQAEIGRATVYSYFASLDELIAHLGSLALQQLEADLASIDSISAALDVPVRLSQRSPARFDLLFPQSLDPRTHMNSNELKDVQASARELLSRLVRIAKNQALSLPESSSDSVAFITAVSMAGATVPALKDSTTLRHRFHDFCLLNAGKKAT